MIFRYFRDDDPDPLHDFIQFDHEEISENLLTISAISRALDDEVGRLERRLNLISLRELVGCKPREPTKSHYALEMLVTK